MKKFLLIALAALMALSLFVSCEEEPKGSGDRGTVVYKVTYHEDGEEDEIQYFVRLVEENKMHVLYGERGDLCTDAEMTNKVGVRKNFSGDCVPLRQWSASSVGYALVQITGEDAGYYLMDYHYSYSYCSSHDNATEVNETLAGTVYRGGSGGLLFLDGQKNPVHVGIMTSSGELMLKPSSITIEKSTGALKAVNSLTFYNQDRYSSSPSSFEPVGKLTVNNASNDVIYY